MFRFDLPLRIGCLVVAGAGGVVVAGEAVGTARLQPDQIAIAATGWPRADALFHRDPRWLGSDGAYSVALSTGRILWLFGDTLIAPKASYARTHGYFVRNTVAIEQGNNPARASISFYWRSQQGAPSSFFADDGTHWFWPGDGIAIGRKLVIFLERVKEDPQGTPGWNFRAMAGGWRWWLTTRPVRRAGSRR